MHEIGTNIILIDGNLNDAKHFFFFFMTTQTVSVTIELAICIISMRGSILDTSPRVNIHYWLYGKLGKNKNKDMQSKFNINDSKLCI